MCGIIAIKGKNNLDDSTFIKMLTTLNKRGPDEQKFVRIKDCILGQTRLSIVDIASGKQPMRDNSSPLTIIFNGEIYDYKELKKELEQKGHIFTTNSDTEVILKSYIEYGHECTKHLDGMFAFIIFDEEKDQLFFARDRFGKKPFYYTIVDGVFFCASEIKAIFESGKIKGEINPAALSDYLRLGYIGPDKTIYNNIQTILPAHSGTYKDGIFETSPYWSLEKKDIDTSYEDAKNEIKRLFDAALKKRMTADVEIGSLLSGGVDSTLTTYYAQKYSSFPIKTFSVGYEGTKNELSYALEASKKIGTDHYTLPINSDLSDALVNIITYMDEPHGDSSNFPQHLISKLASSKVKVVLTGDGADELFMGYGWYQKKMHIPRWNIMEKMKDAFTIQQSAIEIFNKKEIGKMMKNGFEIDETYKKSLINNTKDSILKINNFDLQYYLPGQLLSKIDRTSMMNSLEVRSPFLDTKLIEYVYSLPKEFKISKTENKIILKDILSEIFPKEFVYRRKQGFGAPVKEWLKQDKIKNLIDKTLLNENSLIYKYLNKCYVKNVMSDFERSIKRSEYRLWILLCLGIWFEEHKQFIK